MQTGFVESLLALDLLTKSSTNSRSVNFSNSSYLIDSLFVDTEFDDKTEFFDVTELELLAVLSLVSLS